MHTVAIFTVFLGKSPVSIFGKLEKIWEDLSKVEPSLLVLDNMDVLFCKTENIVVNNPIEASHTDRYPY